MAGYIGNIPTPQATQSRQSFTATASQTTFATIGYTPNYVDVYLNGVHLLDGTDYTATNGSDVVLTVGAAVSDIVEVISYETFAVLDQTFTGTTTADVLTTTGAFTSLGIDDNATSTAMTLDASGNLLVGTTNTNIVASSTATDEGFVYVNGAALTAARSAGQVADFNRITNDGEIIRLRKDGAAVGSIGAGAGGFLTIGSPNGTPVYATFANGSLKPTTSLGSNSDGGGDLGNVSARWKDLYLSGGVHLGGTGSANKLDDYEEGTFTPELQNVSVSYSSRGGNYTKIGRLVYCDVYFNVSSLDTTDSSGIHVAGLPFTARTGTGAILGSLGQTSSLLGSKANINIGFANESGGANVFLFEPNANSNYIQYNEIASSGQLNLCFMYYTD